MRDHASILVLLVKIFHAFQVRKYRMTLNKEDYKPHSQLLLFLQNMFRDFVCEILTYSCLAIHYIIILIEIPYLFFICTLGHLYMIVSLYVFVYIGIIDYS